MPQTGESVFAHERKTPSDSGGYDWGYILTVAKEHRRDLILAHLVAIFAVLVTVPIPLLMPLLVDEVLLHKPATLVGVMNGVFPAQWHGPVLYIGTILLLTMCLRMTGLLLGVWQTMRFTLVAKDVTYRMRRGLLARLQTISMAEYETLGSGAVASRFVTDLNVIDGFVGVSLSKTLVSILSLMGITVILLWMHWQLALFILFMNPLVIYFTVALGKGVKHLKRRENSAFEIFQQALVETLEGIHEIRAGNRERHYLGRVMEKARKIKEHSAAFSWRSDAAGRFSFGVFLLGFDIFRAISMLMVVYSNLSVGEMMAVFGYLWFMMGPVQEVLNIQYAWYGAKAAMQRINQLFELQQEPEYPHLHNPFSGRQTVGIEVRDICFSYARDSEAVLRHVNLEIRPAETVALVGASGGGKSTLVQILLGMYPAQQGMLYFDGVPVTEIGLDVVRDNVATVMQHPAIFNDSLRQNLTLGLDIVDETLWQALETAQLHDVVLAMPQGLNTIVGRQGVRLSGGQRQRLAMARMLLSQPGVVILDEATSALDTATEARLHAAMRDFLQTRTTLIIAHRLSAVKQADRVYVFEDGHIIEEGVHEDLIRSNGLYSRLYGRQEEAER